MTAVLFLGALLAPAALAHFGPGCDGYQHGQNLFARDPAQAQFEARLRQRHPEVNAKVLLGRDAEQELHRRQNNFAGGTTYGPSLTSVDNSAVSHISSGSSYTLSTSPLTTTYLPGATPPVKNAPALPQVSIVPSDWPPLDKPVDNAAIDPNVMQWMSEIDMDSIPNWGPTAAGGCSNADNADAVKAANDRCWWTCGGCTRNTDISFCPQKMTWGLTYDDGPSPYTPELLDYLDAAQLKTTFFAVGSRIISRPEMLQYEYMDGHQIAVHTWSHYPLTTLTNEQIVAEFGYSKKAIYEVLGVTPKYWRAPYGDADDRVRFIASQMGLTQIVWTRYKGKTFDTQDWQIQSGTVNATTVVSNFNQILSNAQQMDTGFIVLEHDLYAASVQLAVSYVLPTALGMADLAVQSVIQCLGLDSSEAYIETGTNTTSGLVPTTTIAGASGTGAITNLTWTPVALGGDATGPVTTLGYTPPPKGSKGSSGSGSGHKSSAGPSSSVSFALLAAILFFSA